MIVVLIRGMLHGSGLEGTCIDATINLFAFAAVGLIVGWIAETTVDDAVRAKLEEELAKLEQEELE